MVPFVLCRLILQMCTCSHPLGLDVWSLVRPFVYFHTSCVQTTKALARLRGCAGSPEPSLVTFVISAMISWAGLNARAQPLKVASVWNFLKVHIMLCMQTVKALARLDRCAGLPEPSLFAYGISTLCKWAGLYVVQGPFNPCGLFYLILWTGPFPV